jgi:hypothetical protein
VSTRTIHATLHDDLHLSKKSARRVPKLLNQDMKNERVRTCDAFMSLLRCHSMAMLDRFVTMDESAVSFHTPQTKQQSKQWLVKGELGPIKAKVHASRSKQMVLAFFDSKGLIYTNYVPKGSTVNANYIVEALGKFLKVFRQKRPEMAARDWWFHWDNAPVQTAAKVKDWMAARQFKVIAHPPYSSDLALADFFLFPKVKRELASLTLTKETFKKEWEGATKTLKAADFAMAFRRWFDAAKNVSTLLGPTLKKARNKRIANYNRFF